ncbi:MATE efflux family protein 1 [Gossypium australe]|uniref:MATE efflux family protein 1 n=1 Tax=Gossypium australe TaxID=47621 RepID=A0A5B6UWN2_9ROSI|nr:MATE efflux family protein 1 [Gossypium australe]
MRLRYFEEIRSASDVPVLVAVMNIFCLFVLSSNNGYIGIWIALTIFMSLCVFAGLLRFKSLHIYSCVKLRNVD